MNTQQALAPPLASPLAHPNTTQRGAPLRSLLSALCLLTALSSCVSQENRTPGFLPLEDVTISSNQSAQIELNAFDADEHFVTFSFELTPPPPTNTLGRAGQPMLQKVDDYQAIFSWTPGNADVGVYALNVSVQDEVGAQSEETITLNVIDQGVSGGEVVRFIEPSGEVLLLNLSEGPCLETTVALEANTLSAEELSLTLGPSAPQGMSLSSLGTKRYNLSWCPSPEQIEAQSQYPLLLIASNSRGLPSVEKRYLVMIQSQNTTDCPGLPPVVTYDPLQPQYGSANVTLNALVSDDLGVKSPPTLAYQVALASQPEPTGAWVRLSMEPVMGDGSAWRALIPPPAEVGEYRVFYEVSALDDDDTRGTRCDHLTTGPRYSFLWSRSAGDLAGYGLCEPCGLDLQCGGDEDRCVSAGGLGSLEGVCARACDEQRPCDVGFECREVVSLSGERSQQCVLPEGCAPSCFEDLYDLGGLTNDSRESAAEVIEGRYDGLSICGDDDDFFVLTVNPHELVRVALEFTHAQGDLELNLEVLNSPSPLIETSHSSNDNELAELVSPCDGASSFELLIHVFGFADAQNDYNLIIERLPLDSPCSTPCEDTFECLEGTYCAAGQCASQACGASSCAEGRRCLGERAGLNPSAEEGRCGEPCTQDDECRLDEVCKRFEDYRSYCVVEGTSGPSEVCESPSDCAGDQICFGLGERGLCAKAGCGASSPCPQDQVCAQMSVGGPLCVYGCEDDVSCAPLGLSCRQLGAVRGCAP